MQDLPIDIGVAKLVGRVYDNYIKGISIIKIEEGKAYDITSKKYPTISTLLEDSSISSAFDAINGNYLCDAKELFSNNDRYKLLSPVDLQAIKACGVTFAKSLLERLVEEKSKGNIKDANVFREQLKSLIGEDISTIKPGSSNAMKLKEVLVRKDLWSSYLEVGIGKDPEVFTKAQPLSSVGTLSKVGLHPSSSWNNPEPEVVLCINSKAKVVGVTLGNDVNLRDIEGRSTLLLGQAKDNNASASLGPFIRIFDENYTLDDARDARVDLEIIGKSDNFRLKDEGFMSEISRDVLELVDATIGSHHQYPDGLCLYTGSLFAPIVDRGKKDMGFTHKYGDVVKIYNKHLGMLQNEVDDCTKCEPWSFGISSLMKDLSKRGLLS